MNKHWDSIAVGVLTFVVVAIILAWKPGYTPLEVTDEVLAPAAVEDVIEETDDAAVSEAEGDDASEDDDASTD